MPSRARILLAFSLVAIPCLAFAHNGRDAGPSRAPASVLGDLAEAKAQAHQLIDIYDGIAISVDPRTGIRTYTQVGDIPANPARARSSVSGMQGPGVGYWVEKEFEKRPYNSGGEPAYAVSDAPATEIASYDEGYYGDYGYYGGYYPAWGYGDGGFGGRPGRGHGGGGGGGRPGGGDHSPPAPNRGFSMRSDPGRFGAPYPAPGVGSPAPYNDRGVGAPPPRQGFGGFRTRRG